METNDERRKRKLRELTKSYDITNLAEMAGLRGPESLDQILKGVLLPVKADGTRSPRSLGDDAARKIETALALPRGWFDEDWPFPLVERSKWDALALDQRGYIQHAINRALDECTGGKPLPYLPTNALQVVSSDARVAHSPPRPAPLTADEANAVGSVEGPKNDTGDNAGRVEGKANRGRAARAPGKGRTG